MIRKILYLGSSMKPLFRRGDILLVRPVSSSELQKGEIIVFTDPQRGQIVHRVMAVTAEGVITKGDNNPGPDARPVAGEEIKGRVEGILRQGQMLPVSRRLPVPVWFLRLRQVLSRWWKKAVDPFYFRLAKTGLIQSTIGSLLKPKALFFSHPEGREGQLWLGKLLIGRKLPRDPAWHLRRPFHLLVDEAALALFPKEKREDGESAGSAHPPGPGQGREGGSGGRYSRQGGQQQNFIDNPGR